MVKIYDIIWDKVLFFRYLDKRFQKLVVLGVVGTIGAVVTTVTIGVVGIIGAGVGIITTALVARAVAKLGSGVALIVLAGVTTVAAKLDSNGILVFLFFLILPLINSIFDYISMYASRYFASNILKTRSKKMKIFLDLVLDLAIAFILLFSLSYTLFFIIEITNAFIIKDESLFIPIQTYKAQILNNPFDKDILWISLMFISTLIPTFLHFLLAIYAIIARIMIKPHLHTLSDELKKLLPNDDNYLNKEEIAKSLATYRLSGVIKWHMFFMILNFIFCCLAIVLIMMTKGIYFDDLQTLTYYQI